MEIDLKAVVHFAHVARTGSFSRSASELGVSQPWLSARIRRLEERLGCQLLERTTRRVDLTEEGKNLLPAAEVLANSASALEFAARNLLHKHDKRLRLGSPPYASSINERFALIERFAAATGAIVEIDIGWSPRLIRNLLNGELDLAFLVDPFDESGLETFAFHAMECVLVVKSDDPLASRATVGAADLVGRTVGTFTRSLNPGLFDLLFGQLIQAGVKIVELPEVRRSMLKSGGALDALVVITTSPAKQENTNEVAKLLLRDVPSVTLKLVRRAGANSQACQHFWEMATSHFERD